MADTPTALVTGASRGIGRAIAAALAPTHRVFIGARTRAAAADALRAIPGSVPFIADLADEADLARAVAAAGIERLDVLVHSAGVADERPFAEFTRQDWRDSFETNVFAVADLTSRLLPALTAARGTIVMINSGSGLMSYPHGSVYTGTKFALRTLADCLREELRADGVRVTSLHPGFVKTEMGERLREEAGRAGGGADTYLDPQELADAVRYAISAPTNAQVETIVLRPHLPAPPRR